MQISSFFNRYFRRKQMSNNTKRLVLAGMFLALCLVLPFLTGQIPEIGSALSPMHIPVLICGFVCGWQYGAAVGLIAPFLRYLLFSMPPLFPVGVAMAFEMAVYGLVAGLLYKKLPKTVLNLYLSLIAAMLLGRIVWGLVRFVLAGLAGTSFSFAMFLSGAFIEAVPGIICHIILVPLVVLALKKAKLMVND
ncbi:MAG: ECF transporter S component [Clostridiales bacterium]|nr:MAG: ECF transporter S component [Clostridiales bacterium]